MVKDYLYMHFHAWITFTLTSLGVWLHTSYTLPLKPPGILLSTTLEPHTLYQATHHLRSTWLLFSFTSKYPACGSSPILQYRHPVTENTTSYLSGRW